MSKPITTTAGGICFAFPNVCWTPAPVVVEVPIPYPSIGQFSDATGTAGSVMAAGNPVVTSASSIASTTGDAAGTRGVTSNQPVGGPVEFTSYSGTVFAEGAEVVRMFDQTEQNHSNAVGVVLGGEPTVLVGD